MLNGVNHGKGVYRANTKAPEGKTYDTVASMPGYGRSFDSLLKEKINEVNSVQFSKHAKERSVERGIEITDTLLGNLNDAVAKARAKGAREVVVIGEGSAFIVNIPNNAVITAMSGNEMKENIFTNIDGAVIL